MKVASNELETTYQAINKLGDGYKFTETYNVDTDSILPQNNNIGSMGIVSSYIPQREEAAAQPTPVLGGQKFAIKATPTQPAAPVSTDAKADIERIIDNFQPKDNFKSPVDSWGVYNEDEEGNSISEIYVSIKGNKYTKEELLEIEDPENPAVQETLNEIDRLQKLLDAELAALENKQPKEKQIELKGKIYNASEINAAMLEKLGYSPTDIGKILKQLC
jgi:hypothetical protein